jgi:hypothetical protein
MEVRFWNFKNMLPTILLGAPTIGALLVITLGIYLFFDWFPVVYPNQPITLTVLLPGFYANCITTILGTGLTVLFFDILTRLRDERVEHVRLLRDIGCGDHGIARRALIEITRRDLHRNRLFRKSILRNGIFDHASLSRAEFLSADMSNSSFHYSDFIGAVFSGAKLRLTGFWGCKLQYADFRDADTIGTDFIFADLTKAVIAKHQLRVAYRLHGAVLPDGTLYDGSFNLPGDIQDAKAHGVDVPDPQAMANFYSMSEEELMATYIRKDSPEYTDWGNV